jgi:hypothetical protein
LATRIIEITEQDTRNFVGSYDDYLAQTLAQG